MEQEYRVNWEIDRNGDQLTNRLKSRETAHITTKIEQKVQDYNSNYSEEECK